LNPNLCEQIGHKSKNIWLIVRCNIFRCILHEHRNSKSSLQISDWIGFYFHHKIKYQHWPRLQIGIILLTLQLLKAKSMNCVKFRFSTSAGFKIQMGVFLFLKLHRFFSIVCMCVCELKRAGVSKGSTYYFYYYFWGMPNVWKNNKDGANQSGKKKKETLGAPSINK